MRPIGQLMAELQRLQVRVWDDGGLLRYQAPRGALAPDLRDELRERKAEVLQFCRRARSGLADTALVPQPRDGTPLPISPAQQRLWLLDRVHGAGAAYNIALALRLRGALHVGALDAALDALMRRHEPLRTAFREHEDTVCQVIEEVPPLPLARIDLRGLAPQARVAAACRQAAEHAAQPFDLGCAPLARFALWQLDGDDHVLLIVVHHIVADGRSLEVLAEEFGACYEAACAGRVADLPPLRLQYADFASHQRARLTDAALRPSLEYWERQLAGLPPLLELPTDRPRLRALDAAGATLKWTLDSALMARLRRIARECGATPFMVLLAGVAALLARYSGRDDIAIGCPVTHRDRPEVERLVGFFVDTLALRIDVSGAPTFRELLARTRAVVSEGFEHQDAPFDLVVETVGGARYSGPAPLVQISVAMLDARGALPHLPGLQTTPFDLGNPSARYDLSLEIYDADGAVDLYWIYRTALFEADTVLRMARHLHNLLAAASVDPARSAAALPLLDEYERHTVVAAWNDTGADFGPNRLVHQLFEAQVERTPDAVAVIGAGRSWSYRELNARADRLARQFVRLGVGPDVLVGVCLERSLELVASLLAVLKAGGGYVPLDPDYPRERLAFMVGDARIAVLLTHTSLAARLPDCGACLVCVDAIAGATEDGDATARAAMPGPENLAYVMYTSGSTGVPKGVMVPHRAISNHMRWMAECFPLTGADAVLQKTPCSFDASVWEFWAPLIAGARLVMAEPGRHADPAYLVRAIRDEQVTVLQMVPALLQLLVEHPEFPQCRSLRRIFSGGEVLTVALARCAAASGAEVYNLYGPTEATIDATYYRCRETAGAASVPIGRPISNMRAYVLDDAQQPLPIGVPGELYLGGAGLASGYLHRPDLTAERFVVDPFSADPGARLYRTGDRVRWLADGNLELLGRIDQQVKIHGVRIELGEIEAALGQHAGVRQVAVGTHEDLGGRVLVAYVAGDPAPSAAELRLHLRQRLPEYMLPAAFVCMPRLPTLPSGKIDRQALPAPSQMSTVAEPTPPRTPTEAAVVQIWAALLGRQHVGVDDDFLELGGHSLAAIRILARVQQAFGVALPARLLFEGGTVASLATAVDEAQHAVRADAAARLRERIDQMDAAQIRALLEQKRAQQPMAADVPARRR